LTLENINTKVLWALQGAGAIFVGIFLAAYLGGIPTTVVLHSEPAFKIPLMIFGVLLLGLILTVLVLALTSKKTD
jgi:hypothetical protein